jgi:hypothetical protein
MYIHVENLLLDFSKQIKSDKTFPGIPKTTVIIQKYFMKKTTTYVIKVKSMSGWVLTAVGVHDTDRPPPGCVPFNIPVSKR